MSFKYALTFGSGDSRNFTGLSPTFVIFTTEGGTAVTSPSITEIPTTGMYYFTYVPNASFTIFFQADGGSSITDNSLRYVKGSLDPIASVDRYLGFPDDSYGSTLGASTVFGYSKRLNEMWQADSTFSKSTGTWNQFAKGTSTLLYSKILTNSLSTVTKL